MLRWLKRVILPLSAVLLLIQVFRPPRTNPPVDPKQEIRANLAVDPAVAGVFARSCNDCHSDRTVWPWYSHVAPVSWLVISDVNRGRKALNFSAWSTYRAEERRKQLAEICKEVTEGEMPGFSYTLIHREAKLGAAEVVAVCRWAQNSGQEFSAAKER
jgi:Haem-binding domain